MADSTQIHLNAQHEEIDIDFMAQCARAKLSVAIEASAAKASSDISAIFAQALRDMEERFEKIRAEFPSSRFL